jgi:hypothetical protein
MIVPKVASKTVAILFFVSVAAALPAGLQSAFRNLDEIGHAVGITKYAAASSQKPVKIAVLDNGFHDYQKALGKTLPSSTIYHSGAIPVDPKTEEFHGTIMAQAVAGLLAQTPNIKYELHLFSTFGYSNLKAAVGTVVAQKFDVVLYAQVWEYGGNGDGKGFINSLINHATTAGLIWVNAAGNFGDATYRAPIEAAADDWVKLPGPNNSIEMRCLPNPTGKCLARIVLSWNDFKEDVSEGTAKDLDLVLNDDMLNVIQTSGLKQMLKIPDGTTGASLYPREIIQAEIPPGVYLIRAKIRSHNFDFKTDELRVTTSGEFTQLVTPSRGETLLTPADNATVITVGASDSEKSSFSRSSRKPELSLPSLLVLANGDEYKGTSNSAAITAAAIVVLKSQHPELNRQSAIALLAHGGSTIPVSEIGYGLSLDLLDFGPADGGDCFKTTVFPKLALVPQGVREILQKNGVAVETTAGIKIFTQVDPEELLEDRLVNSSGAELVRGSDDDMVVVSNNGFDIYPRSLQANMPVGVFEIVQQPADQTLCKKNGKAPSIKREAPSIALPEVGS